MSAIDYQTEVLEALGRLEQKLSDVLKQLDKVNRRLA